MHNLKHIDGFSAAIKFYKVNHIQHYAWKFNGGQKNRDITSPYSVPKAWVTEPCETVTTATFHQDKIISSCQIKESKKQREKGKSKVAFQKKRYSFCWVKEKIKISVPLFISF